MGATPSAKGECSEQISLKLFTLKAHYKSSYSKHIISCHHPRHMISCHAQVAHYKSPQLRYIKNHHTQGELQIATLDEENPCITDEYSTPR